MQIKKFTKEHKKIGFNKDENLKINCSILIEKLIAPKKFRKKFKNEELKARAYFKLSAEERANFKR